MVAIESEVGQEEEDINDMELWKGIVDEEGIGMADAGVICEEDSGKEAQGSSFYREVSPSISSSPSSIITLSQLDDGNLTDSSTSAPKEEATRNSKNMTTNESTKSMHGDYQQGGYVSDCFDGNCTYELDKEASGLDSSTMIEWSWSLTEDEERELFADVLQETTDDGIMATGFNTHHPSRQNITKERNHKLNANVGNSFLEKDMVEDHAESQTPPLLSGGFPNTSQGDTNSLKGISKWAPPKLRHFSMPLSQFPTSTTLDKNLKQVEPVEVIESYSKSPYDVSKGPPPPPPIAEDEMKETLIMKGDGFTQTRVKVGNTMKVVKQISTILSHIVKHKLFGFRTTYSINSLLYCQDFLNTVVVDRLLKKTDEWNQTDNDPAFWFSTVNKVFLIFRRMVEMNADRLWPQTVLQAKQRGQGDMMQEDLVHDLMTYVSKQVELEYKHNTCPREEIDDNNSSKRKVLAREATSSTHHDTLVSKPLAPFHRPNRYECLNHTTGHEDKEDLHSQFYSPFNHKITRSTRDRESFQFDHTQTETETKTKNDQRSSYVSRDRGDQEFSCSNQVFAHAPPSFNPPTLSLPLLPPPPSLSALHTASYKHTNLHDGNYGMDTTSKPSPDSRKELSYVLTEGGSPHTAGLQPMGNSVEMLQAKQMWHKMQGFKELKAAMTSRQRRERDILKAQQKVQLNRLKDQLQLQSLQFAQLEEHSFSTSSCNVHSVHTPRSRCLEQDERMMDSFKPMQNSGVGFIGTIRNSHQSFETVYDDTDGDASDNGEVPMLWNKRMKGSDSYLQVSGDGKRLSERERFDLLHSKRNISTDGERSDFDTDTNKVLYREHNMKATLKCIPLSTDPLDGEMVLENCPTPPPTPSSATQQACLNSLTSLKHDQFKESTNAVDTISECDDKCIHDLTTKQDSLKQPSDEIPLIKHSCLAVLNDGTLLEHSVHDEAFLGSEENQIKQGKTLEWDERSVELGEGEYFISARKWSTQSERLESRRNGKRIGSFALTNKREMEAAVALLVTAKNHASHGKAKQVALNMDTCWVQVEHILSGARSSVVAVQLQSSRVGLLGKIELLNGLSRAQTELAALGEMSLADWQPDLAASCPNTLSFKPQQRQEEYQQRQEQEQQRQQKQHHEQQQQLVQARAAPTPPTPPQHYEEESVSYLSVSVAKRSSDPVTPSSESVSCVSLTNKSEEMPPSPLPQPHHLKPHVCTDSLTHEPASPVSPPCAADVSLLGALSGGDVKCKGYQE